VRDAAPRLEQAWRLRAAGERRHKAFTHAAHELRTPLASIMGFSELLIKRDFDAPTARELLEIVNAQAKLMSTVVTQTFDLARIEAAGHAGMQIEPEPFEALLAQALAGTEPLGHNARIVVECEAGLPPLAADRYRLPTAIANVLANALVFSPSPSPVTVRAWADPAPGAAAVLIDVRDQGIGMTPEQLARIAEPFYRAAGTPESGGTGLGMAIVQEILHAHNGSMEVVSAPGAGTVVTLRVPAAAASEVAHG